MVRFVSLAAGTALALALGASAQAAVTLDFKPSWGSTENTGAAASATFSFSDLGGDVLVSLVLANATGDEALGLGATKATLMGVAFDLPDSDPIASLSAGGSSFSKLFTDLKFQPFGTFDQGIGVNSNFQGGNPHAGLKAGQSTGPITFKVLTDLSAADFETAFGAGYQTGGGLRAAARFQVVDVGAGSDKVFGGLRPSLQDRTIAPIPEPATWLMMILGFGGVGAMLRARRREIPA